MSPFPLPEDPEDPPAPSEAGRLVEEHHAPSGTSVSPMRRNIRSLTTTDSLTPVTPEQDSSANEAASPVMARRNMRPPPTPEVIPAPRLERHSPPARGHRRAARLDLTEAAAARVKGENRQGRRGRPGQRGHREMTGAEDDTPPAAKQ